MRIKLLSADIASKIAAGEVVERPASVLKELLENSIDGKASQIDIMIQRGGIQLLEVRDNGIGIVKEDLLLALTQHATSKINNAQDLASIESLGFRGEALASINSVASLSLTSNTQQQDQAWAIVNDTINIAAHPVGTTVSVRDLFYNMPARRKFLRSERTEYQHLEEVFRRIALSNFTVGFSLKSHDKLLKTLPICHDEAGRIRRLVKLCGQQVINNTISIDAEQNGMRLWGWLGSVQQARSQEPHQYFFINQRVIRDRLINHAIRQVYQPLCFDGKMPFYCLYLELDPVALDVNVHPTKHEVRFRDARIIHAFLTDTLSEALGITKAVNPGYSAETYRHNIHQFANIPESEIIGIIADRIILVNRQHKLLLIDAFEARKQLLLIDLHQKLESVMLNNPQTAKLPNNIEFNTKFVAWCQKFGIGLEQVGHASVLIRSLPTCLHSEVLDSNLLLSSLHAVWLVDAEIIDVHNAIIKTLDLKSDLSLSRAQDLVVRLNDFPARQVWREFSIEDLSKLI